MTRFRGLIALVTAAHAAIGFWIATSTPGPLLSADDVGYLGLGRTLAGNGDVPLPEQPPYGLLYPSLLTPGWAFGLDESAMITHGRFVNSVLGAILIPLLFVLLRRITDTRRGMALLGAVVAASLPAAMLHSSIIWTENLLPVVVVLGLLALVRFVDRSTPAWGSVVVCLAIAQAATHPRAVVSAVTLVGAAAWVAVRRRRSSLVMLIVAEAFALYALLEWARRTVQDAAFGSTGLYDSGDLIDRRGLDEVPDMIVLGAGTFAYLVLATGAIAIVGGIALWQAGLVGRTSLAIVGATIVMAGWFLTGVPRADKWLHGRYVEAVAAPLVAVGVTRLAMMNWRLVAGLGGGIVAAGAYAAWAGPGDNWSRPRSPVMMLGVEPGGAPFGAARFEPGAAASIAVVVLLMLWALARFRPRMMGVVVVALLGAATMSGLRTLDDLYAASIGAEADASLGSDVMGVSIDPEVASSPWIAVAWRVGLDDTVIGPGAATTTHVLVPTDSAGPVGAAEVGTVTGAVLYRSTG